MNPQIQSMEIGIRNIRAVTIYPLSMADQFKLSDIVTDAMKEYGTDDTSSDVEIFEVIMGTIQENLIAILDLITDPNEHIKLDELTNTQFSELCELIYSTNYDTAIVKFKSLFEKAKKVFQSKRQLPKSSSELVTDTNISSDTTSEKEG